MIRRAWSSRWMFVIRAVLASALFGFALFGPAGAIALGGSMTLFLCWKGVRP